MESMQQDLVKYLESLHGEGKLREEILAHTTAQSFALSVADKGRAKGHNFNESDVIELLENMGVDSELPADKLDTIVGGVIKKTQTPGGY